MMQGGFQLLFDTITNIAFLNRASRIETHNLLTLRMDGTSQNAHLRWSAVRLCHGYSADIDSEIREIFEQLSSLRILADKPDGEWFSPESPEVVDGVCAPSRNKLCFAMVKDKHRRFSRDP